MALFRCGPAGGIGQNQAQTGADPIPPSFDAPPENNERISGIEVRAAGAIDRIQVIWTNTLTGGTRDSPEFGGDGGNRETFSVDRDDYLTEVIGWTGFLFFEGKTFNVVRGLQFKTKDGRNSPRLGQTTEFPFLYQCPPGFQIVGIFGRSGGLIDQLGVYTESIPAS